VLQSLQCAVDAIVVTGAIVQSQPPHEVVMVPRRLSAAALSAESGFGGEGGYFKSVRGLRAAVAAKRRQGEEERAAAERASQVTLYRLAAELDSSRTDKTGHCPDPTEGRCCGRLIIRGAAGCAKRTKLGLDSWR